VQTHDETKARNPITIAKFAQHFARSVDAFLRVSLPRHYERSHILNRILYQDCQPGPQYQWYPQWHVGPGFIDRNSIIIVGAVHVSAGSWMPIIQLNHYII
jgi:hypothetical protein